MTADVLGVVCCRGGSKGVPGKNLKSLAGKPLLGWTLEQAKASGVLTDIACSSDDDAILDASLRFGANTIIKRPAELATDEAGTLPAVVHALNTAEAQNAKKYEWIVLLQVTSPFRKPSDIASALDLAVKNGAGSVLSVTPSKHSPYFTMYEKAADGTYALVKTPQQGVVRRQDAPPCFTLNGSIYVWNAERFMADPKPRYPDTLLYEMGEESAVDIDTPLDFTIADLLMKQLTSR